MLAEYEFLNCSYRFAALAPINSLLSSVENEADNFLSRELVDSSFDLKY